MLFEYVFVYLMIDAFCLLFAGIIFSKLTIDMGTEREVRALRWFIAMFACFLATDAVWALGMYGYLPVSSMAVGIVEDVTMVFMGGIAYFWFVYAENRLGAPYASKRWFFAVAAIPIAIVVLLFATSPLTGLLFEADSSGAYVDGAFSWVPLVVFMLYVVFIAVHALAKLPKETSSTRRREDMTLVTFVLFPTACGVIDLLVPGMPVMAISVFTSVLLVFMNSQDARINTDALTGLNNRRRATEYIEDSLAASGSAAAFVVFMVDVDYFKDINDTWGHAEGDHALQMIADGLRRTADGRRALVARWGGDEFLMAVFLESEFSAELLEGQLRQNIDEACKADEIGYPVSVSIGFAQAVAGDTIVAVVARADEELYHQKAERHEALSGGR